MKRAKREPRPRPFKCPACGKAFTMPVPAEKHPHSVDCLLVRTREKFAARGFARAYSWATTLAACGFPIERGPATLARVPRDTPLAVEPWRSRSMGHTVEIPCDGPWTPRYAIEAAYLFQDMKIDAATRREAILMAVEDEEFAGACASARALGGVRAVHELLVVAMKQRPRPSRTRQGGGRRGDEP